MNNKNTDDDEDCYWYYGKPSHIKADQFKTNWDETKDGERKDTNDETRIALVKSNASCMENDHSPSTIELLRTLELLLTRLEKSQ